MFCAVDQAYLCASCDDQIHGKYVASHHLHRKPVQGRMEESSGGRSNSTLVRCSGDTISQTDKDLGEKGEKGAIIRGTLGARQPEVGIISGEAWPELKGGRRPDKGNMRLTLAPGALLSRPISSGYQPSTEGGKCLQRIQMAEDIKRNMFCSSVDSEQFDALDESCYQLEAALDRMEKVCWGSAIDEEPRDNLSLGRREVGDESGEKRGMIGLTTPGFRGPKNLGRAGFGF